MTGATQAEKKVCFFAGLRLELLFKIPSALMENVLLRLSSFTAYKDTG